MTDNHATSRDIRMAAAVIKAHRRGGAADVAEICADPEVAHRGAPLLQSVLHLHAVYITWTRTPAGIEALNAHIQALAVAGGNDTDAHAAQDTVEACLLIDAHGRGDLDTMNRIMGSARGRGRATHVFVAVLDLFMHAVPDLSSVPGVRWLDGVVEAALNDEQR